MKIVFLITRLDILGGAQVHVADLARAFKNAGHDICVLSGGDIHPALCMDGIEHSKILSLQRSIHPLNDIKAVLAIRKTLSNLKPDIVACHSSKAGLVGRIAARLAGVKSVFTAHGWAFTDGVSPATKKIYIILEKFAALFTDHVITVSRYDRDLALSYNILPPDKMTAILNGMPDMPKADINHASPASIIMVARFGEQKNHALLLDALAGIKDLAWSLTLVGGGDDTELKSRSERLGIHDRVRFLGQRHDVRDLLSNANIFVLTSHWEGLPLSILEAMRAGLPVIASNVGGVREAVEHKVTGFLIGRHDTSSLIHALRSLIENSALRETMGAAGRNRFEREFTFDAMSETTMGLYKTIISR